MAEELDQPPLKDVYRKLITDGETSPVFRKYSFTSFRDRMLTNPDASGEVADFLIDRGVIKDREEWKRDWLEPSVPKAPKPVAPQPPSRPVQVPTLLQPAQPTQSPSLTAVTGQQAVAPMPKPYEPFQFQSQAEIDQAAKSPVFLANPMAVEAQKGNIIMPTKEAEASFEQMSPEQQQAAIQGSSGNQLAKDTAAKKRTWTETISNLGSQVGALGQNIKSKLDSGLQNVAGYIPTSINFMIPGTKEYDEGFLYRQNRKRAMFDKAQEADKLLQDEATKNNIETSVMDAIGRGEYGRVPEAVGYNVGQAALQILPTIFTGGYSMFLQTLPDAYKSGVERVAEERGITPQQVIDGGYDSPIVANLSAGVQAMLEKAGAGLVQKSVGSKGGILAFRDWLKKTATGQTATGAALGEGLTEAMQTDVSRTFDELMASSNSDDFMEKLNIMYADPEFWDEVVKSAEGGLIGGGGLSVTGKAIKNALGRIGAKKTPPTSLGGIPTQPVPENAPAFVPEAPAVTTTETVTETPTDTTFVTVTDDELNAFKNGQVDPERLAGVQEDADAVRNGELTLEAIEDPNYREMVLLTLQQSPQQAASETVSLENKVKETENKIKNKNLFLAEVDENGNRVIDKQTGRPSQSVGELISQSDDAPVPTSVQEINGIEFVQFSNPKTGDVDVIVTGKNDGSYVGYYRLYVDGKPTNQWSSKFENPSRNKEDFKTMISGVQSMLPEGHEYTEKTSISTDGLRVWNQQLNRGYQLQYDGNGNLLTNRVAINGDAIVNELGIDVDKGSFENISVRTNADIKKVKQALLPYLQKLGLNESNLHFENGTVYIDLPVLKKQANGNINAGTSQSNVDEGVGQRTGSENVVTDAGVVPAPTGSGTGEVLTEQPAAVPLPQVEQTQQAEVAPAPTMLDTKNIQVNGIVNGFERIFGDEGVGDVREKLPYGENSGNLIVTGKDGNKYVVAFSRVGGDGSDIFETGVSTPRPGQINVSVKISDNATEQEIAAATAQAEGALQAILPTVKDNFIDPRAIRDVLSAGPIQLQSNAPTQQGAAEVEVEPTATDQATAAQQIAREFLNIDRLVAKGFVNYVDDKTGKPCAKFGMRDNAFSRGSKWEIVKDLKGYATHEKGGVDLTIDNKGVRIGGADSKLYAADGLLMPGDGEPIPPQKKQQLAEEERVKFLKYMDDPTYKKRLGAELFGDKFSNLPDQNKLVESEYAKRRTDIEKIPISEGDIGSDYGLYTDPYYAGRRKNPQGTIQITNVSAPRVDHPSQNEGTYRQVVAHELGHASHRGDVAGEYERDSTFEQLVDKYHDADREKLADLFNPNLGWATNTERKEIYEAANKLIGAEQVQKILKKKEELDLEVLQKQKQYGKKYDPNIHGPFYPEEFTKIIDTARYNHLKQNPTEIATRMIGIRRLAADKFGYDFNTPFDISKYKEPIRKYLKENNMIDEVSDLDTILKLSDDQINEMMKYIAKNNNNKNGEVYG